MSTPPIVHFYEGNGKDAQGRGLKYFTTVFSDGDLESCHDYIQTLFPLPERSPIHPSAPVIDRATFDAFQSRPELRRELRNALERMCKFYGLELRSGKLVDLEHELEEEEATGFSFVLRLPGEAFIKRAKNWVKGFDHNHLRITRIIRCLRVLGLEEEAEAFFDAIIDVHEDTGIINAKSINYWKRAMERPLYLAPEDDEDEGNGKDFLYEYERRKAAEAQMMADPEAEGKTATQEDTKKTSDTL